ncbi:MAG: InlB B-repeat-containing protein [Lachnospiraceae bacterium]|nr:InlB B-repeat-containing protein [Lachnospiraceae bacterium]
MLKDIYGNIINENATEISSTQTGYIKVVAVYNNATYNIDWELGTNVSFKPDYIASTSYTYNVGLTLPDASVLNLPAGKGFLGWNIRQAGKPDILDALIIEPSSIGDVTVVAHYDDEYFSINWDLGQGYFIAGFATPSSYRAGSGQVLPTSDKVVTASIKLFDHWEINGVETTSIPVTSQGAITIVAKYKYDDMWFGTYPQNDTSGNQYEPIRWEIITQNENEALLIPEKIIDDQAYNNSSNITWENCSIRSWLNNTFITGAFTSNQISVILEKTIHTTGAPTYPDSNTLEKVFLLSTSEIDGYSGVMGSATAQATPYAKAKNNSALKVRDGNSPWWLRNLYSSSEAYIVDYNGYLPWIYGLVDDKYWGGVRPVFYINLQSSTFQNTSNNVSWDGNNLFNEDSILWESFDKYFGGQKLPTAENMRDRKGSTFLGWRINNSTILYDEIPMTQTGDITLTPVWVAPVTWRLGHNATFSEINLATPSYNIGIGFDLPDGSKVISTRTFDHWAIVQNGVIIDDNVTRISEDIEGPIEIVAIYTDSEYNISWNMGPLSFVSDYIASTSYLYGVGYSLPDVSKINLPPGYEFNYWIIKQTGVSDITHATNISVETYGDVEIEANYSEIFWFGTYPQNDSSGTQLEPIKWKVLSKNDDEALLIADNILDSVPYHSALENTTWATSSIRSWLDTTFKTKAFTENQINSGIVSKSISTDGNNTIDQIFLLSRYDSENENAPYFSYDEEKKATASTYAKTINTNLSVVDGYSPWWLRSRGGSANRGTYIDEGGILRAGEYVNSSFVGVRPVLYIDLHSPIIKTSNNHISFNLNGATWKENSKLWQEMDGYQGGQKLPTLLNLNMPKRKIFTGWTLSDDQDNIITEIPVGQTGDIVLEANFIDCYDIFFGTYPQSVTWQNDGSTYDVVEPIKWNMLSYNGSEAFLISDKILDNVTYDPSFYEWSGSHIQYWLYSIFYDKAFSFDEERAGVKTTRVKTPGSSDTDDDVFLLSKDEAENELYFSNADERKAAGTQYAKTVVNDSHTLDVESNGCSYYWLRQAPEGVGGNSFIYVVQPDGQIAPELVYNKIFGVRPAITIDLSSPIFNATESEINWQVGSDASFLSESTWTEFTKYREGFVNKLPTDGNFATRPDGKVLIGWLIDNGLYKVATYSIPETTKGDISVKPIWGTAGQKLINYDLYIATTSEYGRFLSEPPYVYTPGETFTLPDVSNVEDPSGRIAFSWQIDGVDVTEIASTSTTDVEVKAIFDDTGTYKLDFDMGGGYLTGVATPSEYIYGVETSLPASTSVVAPYGREFSHWMLKGANGNIINPNTATISDTQRGYVKVVAVYNLLSYRITWDLGSGRFINSFATPSEYKYSIGLKLPASTSVIPPIGHDFNHWEIGGIATTSITKTDYGDKHVVAIYNPITYHISWNLDDGTTGNHGEWDGTAGENTYTYGTAYPLPTNVTGPTGRIFNNWEIEGIATTSIPIGSFGDKEIDAKYRNATYSVTWHNEDGSNVDWVSGFTATTSYTYSMGMTLPSAESIVAPITQELDYWIIRRAGSPDIEHATSIAPTLTGNVDIIAVYKYATYTINYDTVIADVDIATDSVTRTYASADTVLASPSKTNYAFVGWYRDYDSTTHTYANEYTGNDDIYEDGTSSYTIYAKWQAKITYNTNGHGAINPSYEYVNLWDNTTLATLSNVTGYTFDLTNSWYDGANIAAASLIGAAGSIYTVTEPKILYARWNGNEYTINYNTVLTDVTITDDHINKTYGTPITLASPSKIGYNFVGWYKNYNSTTKIYSDKYDGSTDIISENGGTTTIYAKWRAHTYTIKYNVNDIGTTPSDIQKTYDTNITLSNPTNIPTGYTFDGWYSNTDLSDAHRYEGSSDLTTSDNVDVNIYARWKAKIIYNANGHGTNPAAVDVILNTETTLPSLAEVTGFEHDSVDSWYDGSNVNEAVRIGQAGTNYLVTAPKMLYAKWNPKTYPVTLNLSGGGVIVEGNVTEYTYGEGATLPTNVTRNNYVFKGWWTENGTTSWGSQVTTIGTTETEEKTYYARWAESYTVTFNLTTGTPHPTGAISNEPSNQNIEVGHQAVRPSINPSAANVVFDNWYTDDTFNTTFNFNTAISGPTTIYAKWIDATTYEVSFNLTEGSIHPEAANITNIPDSQFVVNGNKAISPTNPSSNGYRFVGWYANDTLTTAYNFETSITADSTIYAKWELINYTITYNKNNGEFIDGYTEPTNYNITNTTTITLPTDANITRSHYTFAGWYKRSDYSGTTITSLDGLSENLTLYAKWTLDTSSGTYHTINFLPGDGTGSMSSQYAFEGEDTILNASAFTRSGYTFNNWSSSDGRSFTNQENIGNVTSDLILTAAWRRLPSPSPYNPGGGGRSSGGGGGGGGGHNVSSQIAPTVIFINAVKTIKATVDAKNTAWIYDPVSNKFKMNLNINGQTISASDGFYLIKRVNDQNINGIITKVPVTDTYYFDASGNMVTGWIKTIDNKWYFLEHQKINSEGQMKFGWCKIQDVWYYFTNDGSMLENAVTPDGYQVGANGAWKQ